MGLLFYFSFLVFSFSTFSFLVSPFSFFISRFSFFIYYLLFLILSLTSISGGYCFFYLISFFIFLFLILFLISIYGGHFFLFDINHTLINGFTLIYGLISFFFNSAFPYPVNDFITTLFGSIFD